MKNKNVDEVRRQALQHIIDSQRADGSFPITSSEPAASSRTAELLLHCLMLDITPLITDHKLDPATEKLAGWISVQLHAVAPEVWFASTDTAAAFTVLASLYQYRKNYLNHEIVAAAVRFLVDHEIVVGGPYWNVRQARTELPDAATNASINRFISSIAKPLPNVSEFIRNASGQPPSYYIADWANRLLNGTPLKPLGQALGAQQHDDPWSTEYVCKDPTQPETTGFGMSALSACIALLELEHVSLGPHRIERKPGHVPRTGYVHIATAAHQEAEGLGTVITPALHTMLDRLTNADQRQEIAPLAVRFAQTVQTKRPVPKSTLEILGIANLYAWTAYTIYDDFLDDEGVPLLLSPANVALRKSLQLFSQAMPSTSASSRLISATFDTIDRANAWEIANCRFRVRRDVIDIGVLPNYEKRQYLYQRSLSHSLPIIGTLYAGGYSLHHRATQRIYMAFKNYLIIRQISDDLYDWNKDVREGHISYVVMRLLRDAHISPGKTHLPSLVGELERTFWRQTLPAISQEIMQHAQLAQKLLSESGILAEQNTIGLLVEYVQENTRRTLQEQNQAAQFIQAFQAG